MKRIHLYDHGQNIRHLDVNTDTMQVIGVNKTCPHNLANCYLGEFVINPAENESLIVKSANQISSPFRTKYIIQEIEEL